MKKESKFGFTLAEVLITLGVIGVVAALTLPTIIQKQNERVTVTRLKRIYSVLQQSYTFMESKYGSIDLWAEAPIDTSIREQTKAARLVTDRFVENVKKSRVCNHGEVEDCGFVLKVKNLSETTESGIVVLGYRAYWTAIDANFGLSIEDYNCKLYGGSSKQLQSTCGHIFVDLNGKKPPNAFGKDLYVFYLTKYGIIPYGVQNASRAFESDCKLSSGSTTAGSACTAWVIYNENMDYLHCDNLSWNGKTKCK